MADDPHNASDISDPVPTDSPKEDAATKATREELKQTVISDHSKPDSSSVQPTSTDETDAMVETWRSKAKRKAEQGDNSDGDQSPKRVKTPETDVPTSTNDSLKEKIASPKKKRAHEEVDETKAAEASAGLDEQINGGAIDRTDRNEPEKKRARDKESDEEKEETGATVRSSGLWQSFPHENQLTCFSGF